MSELRKMFAMVGDCGVFSREEIEDFMVEADRVRGHFDTCMMYDVWTTQITSNLQDGNGKLDYEEFIKMLKQYD